MNFRLKKCKLFFLVKIIYPNAKEKNKRNLKRSSILCDTMRSTKNNLRSQFEINNFFKWS